ncbi:MAG TPA: hypothetical protein VF893_00340 [Candidatus Bathyarchaeia archaeon]
MRVKILIIPALKELCRQGYIMDMQEASVVLPDILAECAGSVTSAIIIFVWY